LTELNPRWIAERLAGPRIGLSFDCPHCRVQRLAVPFHSSAVEYLQDGHTPARGWDAGYIWTMTGDSFENLSLSPSVDASHAGHWHGFITNGEIR
jgi:hypothetical protein